MVTRLCIDVGNTRTKVNIFEDDEVVFSWISSALEASTLTRFIKTYQIKVGGICQSGFAPNSEVNAITSQIKVLHLDHTTKIPINNLYKTPSTLGKDRLAAAIGVRKQFPNENCIIVNAGTCITFDFIDNQGNYHGGNISPGITMRLQAMNKFTSRLPYVAPKYNEDLLAKSTEEALQNGAVKGAIYEFETFITRVQEKYGPSKVIVSGGDAQYFENQSKFPIFAVPNLVLIGLNETLKFNGY
jgi:type III pantothenate kinase